MEKYMNATMGNYEITMGSVLAMLLVSLGAAHLGYSIIGFLLFVSCGWKIGCRTCVAASVTRNLLLI